MFYDLMDDVSLTYSSLFVLDNNLARGWDHTHFTEGVRKNVQ